MFRVTDSPSHGLCVNRVMSVMCFAVQQYAIVNHGELLCTKATAILPSGIKVVQVLKQRLHIWEQPLVNFTPV